MYDYLSGTIAHLHSPHCTLDVSGVGYRLLLPGHAFGELVVGQPCKLYTSFVVRETSQQLFGFLSLSDRDLFEILITISGIGPKSGLALLSHLTAQELAHAVQQRDAATLSRAPGVGKRTAERLIVDLADKLPTIAAPATPLIDAVSALINLGYNQAAAKKAVQKVLDDQPTITDLSTLITSALQHA